MIHTCPITANNRELIGIKNVELKLAFVVADAAVSADTLNSAIPGATARRPPEEREPLAALRRKHEAEQSTLVLSQFIGEHDLKPVLVFMDIDGFEVEALSDLFRNLPTELRPRILFERHELDYKPGRDLGFIKAMAANAGYAPKDFAGLTLLEPSGVGPEAS